MLDAILPFCETLEAGLADKYGANTDAVVADALHAAEEGAAATEGMGGGAGRAGYVPSAQLQGVMDPGALAATVWLRAALIDPAA